MSIEKLQAENARLKTEVEHLMIFCNSTLIPSKELQAENARLKAEVERLRKAGDAMVDYIERTEASAYDIEPDGGDRIADWNAAKEGKPIV